MRRGDFHNLTHREATVTDFAALRRFSYRKTFIIGFGFLGTVSYTHLDVYKRQARAERWQQGALAGAVVGRQVAPQRPQFVGQNHA